MRYNGTFTKVALDNLVKHCEEIQAGWNGEDTGMAEERYQCASGIIDMVKELQEALTTI
jgi:hypothetical protein